MKFAVIGFGNRGQLYTDIALKHTDAELVAVCDISYAKRKLAEQVYGLNSNHIFSSSREFFCKIGWQMCFLSPVWIKPTMPTPFGR